MKNSHEPLFEGRAPARRKSSSDSSQVAQPAAPYVKLRTTTTCSSSSIRDVQGTFGYDTAQETLSPGA